MGLSMVEHGGTYCMCRGCGQCTSTKELDIVAGGEDRQLILFGGHCCCIVVKAIEGHDYFSAID